MTDNKLKLHLGCGERYLPGYIHIDINKFEHIDYYSTIDDLSFFEDSTVDEIYASHVLEYYDIEEVNQVLKEWFRVLKKNGEIRLAVPNFENLVKVYLNRGSIDDVIGPIIGRWQLHDGSYIYHKQIFDKVKLSKILENAGFIDITSWDWREFVKDYPNYDDHSQAYFPHMDKENGIHVSLNLLCKKK